MSMPSEKTLLSRAERMLKKSTDKAIETMTHCINVHKKSLLVSKGSDSMAERLGYFYLHHTIAQTDLLLLLEKHTLAHRPYEKTFFSRMLALHVCEFLDDINMLIGRDLLKELDDALFREFIPSFKALNKSFANIKKKHGHFLRTIRNKAGAHRTFESLSLVEFTQAIDSQRVFDIACEVRDISHSVVLESNAVTQKLIRLLEMMVQTANLLDEGHTNEQAMIRLRELYPDGIV